MRYQTFSDPEPSSFGMAILVPELKEREMRREYIEAHNFPAEEVVGYELAQQGKKTPAWMQREHLDNLMPTLEDLGVEYVLVGNAEYFKTLAGVTKAEPYLGYVLPNAYPENQKGKFWVAYVPNFKQVMHDPERTRGKIAVALDAVWNHVQGQYRDPGCDIIRFAAYPTTTTDIAAWLNKLLAMDRDLSADIETFSLKPYDAGIGTISFSWDLNEGICFPVDLGENPAAVRKLLKEFFVQFRAGRRRMRWHNIAFDVTVLIYQLFMEDILDTEGLLDGLDVMLDPAHWDCTKLITYLATNTCAGNELGLKIQSQEFSGNYAVEVTDITAVPLPELLRYNLIDALSTQFVYDKHHPRMVDDEQEELYEGLFKATTLDIVQMQLTGLPVDMARVRRVREILDVARDGALERILDHPEVAEFSHILNEEKEKERYQEWLDRKAAGIKVRSYQPGNFREQFNPNSPQQKQALLYEQIGLPVIELTDTKQPATGKDVVEKLKAYTQDQAVLDLLDTLLEFAAVDKICGTFLPAMENALQDKNGWHWLLGNFNLGGALSGRLSSSDPNLQNIPVNATMVVPPALLAAYGAELAPFIKKGRLLLGKFIKSCFVAPAGWLLVGLDFDSLEDRISALTTRDPNKLKVYVDGYDGHSLRAHSYFGERMPDIETVPENVECYRATINGVPVLFHADEEISYLGRTMTAAELWEHLSNVRIAAE